MTLPVPRRGPTVLTITTAIAAAWLGGAAPAQQPAATQSPPPASASQPAAATAPAKKAPAKATPGEPSPKSAQSYSLGVMFGEQLRDTGLRPETLSAERFAQGVRDALAGKASLSDQDRQNVHALSNAAIDANHQAATKFLAANARKPGVVTTASGLQYQELTAGSGDSPRATDSVSVNYRGTLLDGSEFDSSYKRGQPATFEVDRVIPGWTEALQLMKPGARWKLFIPPQLAYDSRPRPGSGIPPGAALLFEVELLGVKPAAAADKQPAAADKPAPAAAPPSVPASALPKPTGQAPVNPPESPNAPSPASIKPPGK
jgi:FKBP-type peptidyl-prolyl cis-trans isomerase